MTEGDVEILGRRLMNELGIQPWPILWERGESLKEYLKMVMMPANVPTEQWLTARASVR